MSDRELLELATKAAEYVVDGCVNDMIIQPSMEKAGGLVIRNDRGGHSLWNPLADDGDALRLAVKLEIDVSHYQDAHIVDAFHAESGTCSVDYNGDPYAATRRAIVLVAAEIGKATP